MKWYTAFRPILSDRALKQNRPRMFIIAVIERINSVTVTVNVIIPLKDQFIPLEDNRRMFGEAKYANVIEMDGDHNFLETKVELIKKVGELLTDDKYTI